MWETMVGECEIHEPYKFALHKNNLSYHVCCCYVHPKTRRAKIQALTPSLQSAQILAILSPDLVR